MDRSQRVGWGDGAHFILLLSSTGIWSDGHIGGGLVTLTLIKGLGSLRAASDKKSTYAKAFDWSRS
jgi:hypothetical protein